MRLLKLRFKNINSLAGEFEIDFTDPLFVQSGIFAIVGPTGSGKSSILDALTLSLYGTTPRRKDMPTEAAKSEDCPFMTKGRTDCFAESVFEAGGGVWLSRYRISYGATGRAKKLTRTAELVRLPSASDLQGEVVAAKIGEWSARIERLTGMNLNAFLRCVLLAQGAFASLLRAPINERALLLERITGTEIYTAIGAQVHDHAAKAKAEVDKLALRLQSDLPMNEQARADKEKALADRQREVAELDGMQLSLLDARTVAERYALAQKRWVAADDKRRTKLEALEAVRPREARLETARRAAAPLREYEAFAAAQSRREAKALALSSARKTLEAARRLSRETAAAAASSAQAAESAEAALAAFRPVYEAATQADLRIAELARKFDVSKKLLADVQREHQRCCGELTAAADGSRAAAEKLAQAEAAVRAHQGDAELSGALPAAETFAAQMTEAGSRLQKARRDAAAARSAVCSAQSAAAEACEAQKKAKAALTAADAERQEANRAAEAASAGSSAAQAVVRMRQAADHWWSAKWALALLDDIRHAREAAALAAKTQNADMQAFAGRVIARAVENGRRLSARYPDIARGLNQAKVDELEKAMSGIRRFSEVLGAAQNRASAAAKAHAEAQSAFLSAQSAAAQANLTQLERTKNLEAAASEAMAAEKSYESAKAAYHDNLARFFSPEDDVWRSFPAQKTLDVLRARAQGFASASAQLIKAGELRQAAARREAAAAAALAESQKREAAAQNAFESDKAALTLAQNHRRDAWGDLAPKPRLAVLEADAQARKRAAAAADAERTKAESGLAAAASAEKSAGEAHAEAMLAEAAAKASMEKSAAEAGFASIDELLSAVMQPETIAEESRAIEAMKNDYAAALGAAQSAEEQLGDAQKAALAHPIAAKTPLFEIDAQLAEARGRMKAEQTELGRLNEALDADDRRRAASAQLVESLEAAQRRRVLWERLDGMIGGGEGKKFRLAAQRFTFRMLLAHANTVLRSMDSRYELHSAGETDLEVAVCDKNMLGIVRTSFNLSGGETFLVSLALALALSKMSSKNLSVNTLFLDEGFGSLDADTLEKALTVLEALQQNERKLIGLISHVRAVRERIDAHIVVHPKTGTGESTISGPGVRVF